MADDMHENEVLESSSQVGDDIRAFRKSRSMTISDQSGVGAVPERRNNSCPMPPSVKTTDFKVRS